MFHMQNAATGLMPQNQLYCLDFSNTYPCYYWHTWQGCHWYFNTYFTCVALTTRTILEQQVACLPGTQPAVQTQPGDPVEQLQALRKQLEVVMAGLEAQERVLRQQQAQTEKK